MNARRHPYRRAAWIVGTAGFAGVGALGSPALGQHALDRNLQVGSGGINPSRPSFAEEVRFRNAIVTGNVPGGMSLRADVGYSAPGELFTRLGSNDLYSFRRDSVYSGLGGLGIRGTEALQYQFAATTGNTPPPTGYGFPLTRRFGTGATGATVQEPLPTATAINRDIPAALLPGARPLDLGADSAPELRSPAAYVAARDMRPSLLGRSSDREGRSHLITASSLRGIALEPGAAWATPEQTGLPPAPPDAEGADRPGAEGEGQEGGRVANPYTPRGTEARPVDTRIKSRVETEQDARAPYDEVIDRVRRSAMAEVAREVEQRGGERPGGGQPGAQPGQPGTQPQDPPRADWERRLDELRAELRDPRTPWRLPPERRGDRFAPPRPGDVRPGPGQPGATGAPTGAAPAARQQPSATDPTRGMSPETIRLLRATRGEEVRALAPAAGHDPYAQAMRLAQDHLAGGRYFDAEERFTSALGARPGDPMAAAGRINAELGAGMFLSAALNLRSLLVDHPEMAGVKYAKDLMPRPERVEPMMARLAELSGEGGPQARDAALLLAYMGYQTGDEAAVRRGLEGMTRAAEGAGPDQVQRLAEMLRAVWLEGGSAAPGGAPGTPAPQPPSPPAGGK